MDQWIDWARGPAFLFCLAFCILGLARLLLMFGWSTVRTWLRAGDPNLPLGRVLKLTLRYLFPVTGLSQRPDDAQRNLPPIGNQDLPEHVSSNSA